MSGDNGNYEFGRTPKVCILTSVHQPFDTRIFHRQAISLAEMGYEVHLVAPAGKDDMVKGVRLHAVKPSNGRGSRMTRTAREVYRVGLSLGADVYHFHDPELIPFGILLKFRGKRVIYDVHEDVPKDILVKSWIVPWLRKPVALSAAIVEQFAAHFMDRIIAANPLAAKRFPQHKTCLVQNFPVTDSLWKPDALPYGERSTLVAYVGELTQIRGVREMVVAISKVSSQFQATLAIAGRWDPQDLPTELAALPGWPLTRYLGILSREEVRDLLAKSRIGLVVLHPTAAYVEAQPTKLYEYMCAAIPVVASNFWRDVVESCGCGLTVDPLDPAAIAQAIQWLLEHPREAEEMGRRGRHAVLERYNWEHEAEVLKTFYEGLLRN